MPSLGEVAQTITSISALGTFIVLIISHVLNARKMRKVAAAVEEVHIATNSLTDRLVATTKAESFAAGVKEEKDRKSEDC